MTNLSKRATIIKESPTFKVIGKANKLKKDGNDVVILAAGEPDFNTPKHIADAAIEAINLGRTKYTPASGTIELREAIVNKFARENNLNYTTDEVIASNGGKHSIYNALQAIVNDGDEVIIPAPYWVSYPDMVLLSGGKPNIIECNIDVSFKLTPQVLKKALNDKTKAIILNSPSNPTGMIYTSEELCELANVLRGYPNVFIISDDLYEHLLFEKQQFKNIANVAPDLLSRVIVINGVSKAYAMTGWRIGYAACKDKAIIKAMDNIQSQSTSNPCSISQYAATMALNSGTECVAPMLKEFIKRHDYVVERLNKIPGIKCLKAQGAFYAFFDCSQAINMLYNAKKINGITDIDMADYLLDNFHVAGVPGSAFGLDKFIRISFATSFEEITKGLDRIEQAMNNIG
ncbi:MAG: pyridoxal phosphate-dependent aminotransferase [Neisseriaceae bacterium]